MSKSKNRRSKPPSKYIGPAALYNINADDKYTMFIKFGSAVEANMVREAAYNEQMVPEQFVRACVLQVIKEGIARMNEEQLEETLPSVTESTNEDIEEVINE